MAHELTTPTNNPGSERLLHELAVYFDLGDQPVGLDDDLAEDLGLDSLGIAQLCAVLGQRLAIQVRPEHLVDVRTVRDLVAVLERHGVVKGEKERDR